MDLLVRDIMTRDVVAVAPDTSLTVVAKLFREQHISGAPVIDKDSRPIGVITLADLVYPTKPTTAQGRSVFYVVTEDATQLRSIDVPCKSDGVVGDLMLSFVLSVTPDRPVLDAVRLMVADEIHRLLVVEDGRLVGILSTMDVMRALAND
jgi:CBS domain-containing membrane protein